MNAERIQQLARQAGIKEGKSFMYSSYDELAGHSLSKQALSTFAALIVQECTTKCAMVSSLASITNAGEIARKTKATADSCITMINDHFGIQQ